MVNNILKNKNGLVEKIHRYRGVLFFMISFTLNKIFVKS